MSSPAANESTNTDDHHDATLNRCKEPPVGRQGIASRMALSRLAVIEQPLSRSASGTSYRPSFRAAVSTAASML